MENNRTVHQWEFHGGNTQKWTFTHLGDGTYSIHSENSSTKYYLGVKDDSSSINQDVVLRTGTITSGMKWTISTTASGAFKLTPQSGETNGCVLATSTSTAANGKKLIQGDYLDNNSYRDEWLIDRTTHLTVLEPQHQTNWCWAASARMLSQSRTVANISQESAAVYVKLNQKVLVPTAAQISNANEAATVGETEKAAQYILSLNNLYSAWGEIYELAVLVSLLDNGNPIIILRGWYDVSGARTGGHFVVISGYHWDSTNQLYVFDILDPWSPNVGATYSMSYQTLCNGRNPAFASDRTDTGRWEGIVVLREGDYNNTIPWPSP